MKTKRVDSKGRVALGEQYAGQLVLVDDSEPGRLILVPAIAVPQLEAWLHHNPKALASVQRGLKEAGERDFTQPPRTLRRQRKAKT